MNKTPSHIYKTQNDKFPCRIVGTIGEWLIISATEQPFFYGEETKAVSPEAIEPINNASPAAAAT